MRSVVTVLGVLLWVTAAIGVIGRYVPVTNHLLLGITALAPILMLGAPIGGVLLLIGRRWILAGTAVVLMLVAVAVELPLFISRSTEPTGVPLRVMSANIYLGQANAASILESARGADLLAVQELTQSAVDKLVKEGVEKTFPFRVLDARPEASGTGLWSRYPLQPLPSNEGFNHAMIHAKVRVPGVTPDVTVLVAHLPGPFPEPVDLWNKELAEWPTVLNDAAEASEGGSVIAVGDFNSTYDMRPFRNLLGDDFEDGAEQSGSGITFSYPANLSIPPVIAIDRLLTHRATAVAVKTIELPGSDHRGIMATVDLPRAPE